MQVKRLIELLQKLPEDAEVVARANDPGFNNMPVSVMWVGMAEAYKHPSRYVWAESCKWASTPDDELPQKVVLIS